MSETNVTKRALIPIHFLLPPYLAACGFAPRKLAMPLNGQQSLGLSSAPSVLSSAAAATYEEPATTHEDSPFLASPFY